MAKIEVDEAEYNRMAALTAVASKIVADPKARRKLEEAHKLVDPNAATPALDAEKNQLEPVNALKTELTEQIAALKKEREDEKREQLLASISGKQEAAFSRLKSQHKYTDEGIAAVRKLMEDKGLLDVDDAVAIFERSNPPQVPTTPSGMTGQAWNFTDHSADSDKDIAALIANKGDGAAADAAAMRMVNATLSELRGSHR
jgi:hypothetical protein